MTSAPRWNRSQNPNDPLGKPAGFFACLGWHSSDKPERPLGEPAGFPGVGQSLRIATIPPACPVEYSVSGYTPDTTNFPFFLYPTPRIPPACLADSSDSCCRQVARIVGKDKA